MERETKNILELIRNEKVEWKKLGEVCEIKNGYTPSKRKLEFWENGNIPWFRVDDIRQKGKILYDSTQKVNKKGLRKIFEKNSLIISTTATIGLKAVIKVPFICNQQLTVLTPNEELLVDYLYYYLEQNNKNFEKLSNSLDSLKIINISRIKNFEIPIPPLSTQEKIVEILDKFTKHTTELQSELQSELQLRKKQYEYYREKLLTFDDTIERKKLCDLLDYEQPTKYIVNSTEYNNKHITPVLTAGQTFILGYTDEKDNIYMASKDNPVIIFDDFTSSNHWVDFNFKIKSSAMKILKPKENVNFRYCYYCIKMINIDTTEHKRLWISTFSQIEIPIPPIEIQEYIVNTLDKLDTLVNDITCGLPKEIELRQKQYEYYRSKLLDFEK